MRLTWTSPPTALRLRRPLRSSIACGNDRDRSGVPRPFPARKEFPGSESTSESPPSPAKRAIQPAFRPITSTTMMRWWDSAVVCSLSRASTAVVTAVKNPIVSSVAVEIVIDGLWNSDDLQVLFSPCRERSLECRRRRPRSWHRCALPGDAPRLHRTIFVNALSILGHGDREGGVDVRGAQHGAALGKNSGGID